MQVDSIFTRLNPSVFKPKQGLNLLDMLEDALFVCICIWYVFELTVANTGWWLTAVSNWLHVSLQS